MTGLEATALALSLAAAISRLGWPQGQWGIWLAGAGAAACLAALVVNPARWQLYPALIALVLLTFVLLPPHRFGTGFTIFAAVLLAISGALAQFLAVPRLPAPTGPHAVGTVDHMLERSSPEGQRRLFIKVWYPASAGEGRSEGLWSDLTRMDDIPLPARWGMAYLSGARTSSHASAVLNNTNRLPVILYNHSLLSWASENSLLAEELASRGNIVIAIRHIGQVSEHGELAAGLGEADRAADRDLQAQLQKAQSREERARLSQLLAKGKVSSEIVRRRAEDSRFVFGHLPEVLGEIPGGPPTVAASYAAMGLSLGGAVSTRLCADDPRCAAVINLDGGLYGIDPARMRPLPYLMVYSGANVGGSDAVREGAGGLYEERIFAEAAHADLHDAPKVLPMGWFGGMARDKAAAMNRELGGLVAEFVERSLVRPSTPGSPQPV